MIKIKIGTKVKSPIHGIGVVIKLLDLGDILISYHNGAFTDYAQDRKNEGIYRHMNSEQVIEILNA